MFSPSSFFDLSETEHAALFENVAHVWEAVERIKPYIQQRFATDLKDNRHTCQVHSSVVFGDKPIFIGEGTKISPGVYIEGPAIIGKNCELRQGAYLRENVVLGDEVVVGHTSELKNTLMLNGAHAPHFSYLGDSLLGGRVNLGAGTKLSNLALTSAKDPVTGKRSTITFRWDGQRYDTGLAKMGAILGDDVQLGCNCVTNPGSIIGPRTLVYALVSVPKGYIPADSIVKLRQQIEIISKN